MATTPVPSTADPEPGRPRALRTRLADRLRDHLLSVLAACFVATAGIFALLWAFVDVDWVDQLAPNVVVEGIGLGIALTVIDRAVRDRDRRRIQPLIDQVLVRVRLGIAVFVMNLAAESGVFGPSADEDVPRDALG